MKSRGLIISQEMAMPSDSKSVLAVYDLGNYFLNQKAEDGELFFLQTRTRASAATRIFTIATGAKYFHVLVSISASLATIVNFYEGVTITVAGTKQVLRNYNRNYDDDNLLTVIHGGATITGGTLISPNQAGFGSNPGQAVSGIVNEVIAYILKPNTIYGYEVIPDASCDTLARSIAWEGII